MKKRWYKSNWSRGGIALLCGIALTLVLLPSKVYAAYQTNERGQGVTIEIEDNMDKSSTTAKNPDIEVWTEGCKKSGSVKFEKALGNDKKPGDWVNVIVKITKEPGRADLGTFTLSNGENNGNVRIRKDKAEIRNIWVSSVQDNEVKIEFEYQYRGKIPKAVSDLNFDGRKITWKKSSYVKEDKAYYEVRVYRSRNNELVDELTLDKDDKTSIDMRDYYYDESYGFYLKIQQRSSIFGLTDSNVYTSSTFYYGKEDTWKPGDSSCSGNDSPNTTGRWIQKDHPFFKEKKWYYYYDNGIMATGWLELNNNWYFLRADGSMLESQWLQYNNRWYYFNKDGVMLKMTWQTIDGKEYYFYNDGSMAITAWIDGSYVGKDGAKVK